MEKFLIKTNQLDSWLKQIIEAVPRVVAPVKKGSRTEFCSIHNPELVDYESITTVASAKAAAFPPQETLFEYSKTGNDTELKQVDPATYPQTVIWRARPCDVLGFKPLGGIFNWDYKDTLYNQRFEKVTLIAFSCTKADACCFCTSVGGGPGKGEGSDVLITCLPDENSLVEVFTPKGEQALAYAKDLFTTAPDNIDKESALAKVETEFTAEQVHEHLAHAFESEIWKQQSERCLGCGACAFVCPTCACFDIQEDTHGSKGRRVRCWDSCGFSLFTQHTSGHNPRPTQSTRWRQRILHKFSYMPDRIGTYGCTGCGRCSRACPVDMNIKEHLLSIATSHE